MKETLRNFVEERLLPLVDFVTRPITLIVTVVLAIATATAFLVLNNQCGVEREKINSIDMSNVVSIKENKETGKIEVKTIGTKEAQEKEYTYVKERYEKAINPEKNITDKADAYVSCRYNFDNTSDDISKDSLEKIKELSTSDFYKSVLEDIEKDKTKGGCKCSVIRRYSQMLTGKMLEIISSGIVLDYELDINGQIYLVEFTFSNQGGIWLLSDEKTVAKL